MKHSEKATMKHTSPSIDDTINNLNHDIDNGDRAACEKDVKERRNHEVENLS